jgi:outer membrane protein assembly factor BamB
MMRYVSLFLGSSVIALLACVHTAAAGDWPQFRGPTGQGLSDARDVPVEWAPDKNVAWKAEIPGRGWSSPVLAGGHVYLTTAVGDPGTPASLRALCLDAAGGKVVWDFEVFKPDPAATKPMHSKNSLASATPVFAAGRLYIHFGHLGTAALDVSGTQPKVLWRQTELKYSPVHGNGGSPVLAGGKGREALVFNCDGGQGPFVAALDANTGAVKWKTPRSVRATKTFSFSTPLVIDVGGGGAQQVISPASGMVGAYDPATGKELWRVTYDEGYSVVPRPAFAHGLVFVSTAFDAAVLYAIKPAGAAGDVTGSHVAWKNHKGAPNTPSPMVVGDELYLVSDDGIATCADARTGKVHWTERLDGSFSASPVSAAGKVYFQTEDGVGYVVKAGKSFEMLAENDLGERSLASYAADDGALFIRTEKHLWKIGGGPKPAAGQ